jgi:hypothetical protein
MVTRPPVLSGAPASSPVPIDPDEPTVTMIFKEKCTLQLDDGRGTVTFDPGIQEVPESLADHWWLKANAMRYQRTPAEAKALSDARAAQKQAQEEAAQAEQKRAEDELKAAELQAQQEIDSAKAKSDARLASLKAKTGKSTKKSAAAPASTEVTDKHVAFLQSRGYKKVTNVEEAKSFVGNMQPDERKAFFADASTWQQK